MQPLISIIVPVYKVENYINRCIDSLLGQTYKNIEIILIDDGSPDKSGEICDEYEKKDNRVKVFHKKNGGLSDARNVGIEVCKGKYITFIDSDDWVNNNYIEILYSLLKKYNADISLGNFMRISDEINKLTIDKKYINIYEYSNMDALNQFSTKNCIQMVTAWGKLYKCELFNEIRFPLGRIHEDEFTTYKLIYNSKKIVQTTEQLYYYWQREDSIMAAGVNIKAMLDAIDAYKEKAEFFKSIGLNQLSKNTYIKLYYMYVKLNRKSCEFEEIHKKREFIRQFKKFRYTLREMKYPIKFKIHYELYCKFPFTMNIFSKLSKRQE